jgi:hypothetical protein
MIICKLFSYILYVIDDNLSWHCHIDQMLPKLSTASYVIRFLKPLLSLEALKMAYFSTVHSIISYGIIFCGISTYSKIIFKPQKRIVRIIMSPDNKDSCWDLFKKLCFLPLQSQYIFSLLMFVVKNKDFLKQTRIFIVLTQDLIMTYIFPQQIWQHFRKQYCILVLKCITISQ